MNVQCGALLLVPQCQCISSFVFYTNSGLIVAVVIDHGTIPETSIWSILFIQSDLKLCINL